MPILAIDALDELLKLYCDHSTEAIEAADGKLLLSCFNVVKPEELLAIQGYAEAFASVSACASAIDNLAARHPNADDQVRESLRLLRRMLDDGEPAKKVETTRRLVEGRLRKSWPTEQQTLYDHKKQILDWQDFFVSYTNRDAPATNQQFHGLIKSCLGREPKGDETKLNYLAKVITRHLRRYEGLSGFFDEDHLKVGENIEDEVDEYCAKAFALVQLIEPLTFDKEPPRNWCFHEYKQFSENPALVGLLGDKNRHYFILTGQLTTLKPANPFPLYANWYKRIEDLKQTHISLERERNTTLRLKIKNIAMQILDLRKEIIDVWLQ
jgi:hypothetical protein